MPRYLFPAPAQTATDMPTHAWEIDADVGAAEDHITLHADQCKTALEIHYPHVVEKIQLMWGYPEMNTYFLRLTVDERGDRDGFPPDVWDDLHILLRIHHELFPG